MTPTGGPFDEPLFDAIARRNGCLDRGAGWYRVDLAPLHADGTLDWSRVDARGVSNDELRGPPAGTPRFRFCRTDDGVVLVVRRRAWVLNVGVGGRSLSLMGVERLPETIVPSLPGRRLSELVDLPGADEERITRAARTPNGIEAWIEHVGRGEGR